MVERPILFSAPMVRAILDGRKTQTRRIMKIQPDGRGTRCTNVHFEDWHGRELKCPYGWVSDILWVRETWRPTLHSFPIGPKWDYRATAEEDGVPIEGPWKPSIFMPKEACRIKLLIEDVRVEQLHDISEEDAIAEGIEKVGGGFKSYEIIHRGKYKGELHPWSSIPNREAIISYRELWESINGKGSYEQNPWVWVISFKNIT